MCAQKNKPSEDFHIGKILQEKVNRSGLSITEFAEKINLSRPVVYQMFRKKSIDCDLLKRISLLLNENLFEFLYQEVERLRQSRGVAMIKESESVYRIPPKDEKVAIKLEHIHQDLISIKNILLEIKEEKIS